MTKNAYIHIPFCKQICAYCDFAKVLYNSKYIDDYLNSLKQEIADYYQGEELKTIYIGGGTPNALSLSELTKLMDILKPLKRSKHGEYTIECNIELITEDQLKLFKKYHFNRLSLGIETINPRLQTLIGRSYSKALVTRKLNLAKKYFHNINVDLMYALPTETMADLKQDLDYMIRLKPKHISTYSLIIEEHTKFALTYQSIDEDLDADMYAYIMKRLKKYHHYETSNFALKHYESKHNLNYWYNNTYYGFGVGASGYVDNVRYDNTRSFTHYLEHHYRLNSETMTKLETMQNDMILGLRLIDGLSTKTFKKRYHQSVIEAFPIVESLLKEGKLAKKKDKLYITADYLYLANEILINFI